MTLQTAYVSTRAAIRTRVHGPTNTTGTRICVVGGPEDRKPRRLFVGWNYALNHDQNHYAAAQKWLDKHNQYNAIIDGPGLYFSGDRYFTWKIESVINRRG